MALRLRSLGTVVGRSLPPAAKWPEKKADEFYLSAEWRGKDGLREQTLKRDGYQCTAVVDGFRCNRRAIVADHVVRRRDGGADDGSNLRSLCRICDNRFKERWDGSRKG